jgi:hypothetical protein
MPCLNTPLSIPPQLKTYIDAMHPVCHGIGRDKACLV